MPGTDTRRWLHWLCGALGYGALACVTRWPLPLNLKTHLLSDPAGDAGVYVWNFWIFRHELLRHRHLPFSTDHVFAYSGGADFSLHNYAPVADLLGAPLIGPLGVVGAFNVVLLAMAAALGLATCLLARCIGMGFGPAWLAGAAFMASPTLIARDAIHFSVTLAAALPLFLWALVRTLDSHRRVDAMLTGASAAMAFYSDAYFGIFCGLMGAFVVGCRYCHVDWRRRVRHTVLRWCVDGLIVAVVALVGARLALGAFSVEAGGEVIRVNTLYTPVLILTVAVLARVLVTWRPVVNLDAPLGGWRRAIGLGVIATGVCVLLVAPALIGIGQRLLSGRMPSEPTYWRSTPRGVDLLAYLVPNQNHPWFGTATRYWTMPPGPDAFPEFVASFSLAAFVMLAAGAILRALPRMWLGFTGLFILLSLGPFIHVAGVNSYALGPWGLLRYVPVIGMVRSPGRFAIVAVLGCALLFGFAVQALFRRVAHVRGASAALAIGLGVVLAVELTPIPRTLYSAAVPEVYRRIAAAGDESGRLLVLPTGIRDGTSSVGNFSAATQFYQTEHRRSVIGGYLSRVSKSRKDGNRRVPMLRALFTLSEGQPLSDDTRVAALQSRDDFLRQSCVAFVVVDRARAPDGLEAFAVDALRLQPVYSDGEYAVYNPVAPPPCARPARAVRRP